jgi:acyl-CoA hydrolase
MSATTYADVEAIVDEIIDELGTEIVVGAPLGLGKANHILNELTRRAVENPDIDLTVWTALTLSTPDWSSELERRLVEPLVDRIFEDYPELEYNRLLQSGGLPDNIEVHQFYFQPGEQLDVPSSQQHHHNVNYTHVVRAMRDADLNLLVQLVGVGEYQGERHYNLSSNADVTKDVVNAIREERRGTDEDLIVVGQVNHELPFMYGDAPIPADEFDAVLEDESYDFSLFGPPNMPVSTVDHAIGLRVSSLLKDGGTLQIGIGSLGDAIGHAMELRHLHNDTYREIAGALGFEDDCPDLIEEFGGLDPFEEGLYGSSEMFVEAFLHLIQSGILTRETYDDIHIQRLLTEGRIDETVDESTLDELLAEGAISADLGREDVAYLREWGIFRPDVEYDDGTLHVGDESFPADLGDASARAAIVEHALGDSLEGGQVLHGAFFLGPDSFYETLRSMDESQRRQISMRSVRFVNQLYENEDLNRLQRQDARFVNTGMKATVSGSVVSDGLADNRVVSGVGGQFNFVNMAHELEGGRSIIMVRSIRESGDDVESNIVWNYGHITIPRHLRDIVVTEYGVADLRDKSDKEVIAEMIKIADSRFQQDLVEKAKDAGKLPPDWEVPPAYRNNYPETLSKQLEPFEEETEMLPTFPFGTDLTQEEIALTRALRNLKGEFSNLMPRTAPLKSLPKALHIPNAAEHYLERMDLEQPVTAREHLMQRLVVFALAESDII